MKCLMSQRDEIEHGWLEKGEREKREIEREREEDMVQCVFSELWFKRNDLNWGKFKGAVAKKKY